MPPTLLFLCIISSLLLHLIFPVRKVVYPPYAYVGAAAIAIGVFIDIWADGIFKRKDNPVKPHEHPAVLVTSGPFRVSRHPMYLGMALIAMGVSLILGSLTALLAVIPFVVIIDRVFIMSEEENVERIFKEKYRAYKRKVRRWL